MTRSTTASIHKIACVAHLAVDSGASVSTARPAPFRFPYREHRSLADVWAADLADAEHNSGRETTNGLAPARPHSSFHNSLNNRERQRNHG